MLKALMEKAAKKNLGLEFVYAYGLWMGGIGNHDDVELYSYGSTDFIDMVEKINKMLDIIGDPEKEEQLFQEVLNNEI